MEDFAMLMFYLPMIIFEAMFEPFRRTAANGDPTK
jgi:hypothetical protein